MSVEKMMDNNEVLEAVRTINHHVKDLVKLEKYLEYCEIAEEHNCRFTYDDLEKEPAEELEELLSNRCSLDWVSQKHYGILQFSAVDGEGNILLNTYVKAHFKKKWPEASRINKITPDMVSDVPELWELAGKIRGVMESGKILVAYNAAFDLDFLEAVGYIPTNEQTVYDVMIVFAEVYGEYSDYYGGYKWQKLTVAANYFGYQFEAHDSLEDVRATLYCYNKIKEMNK